MEIEIREAFAATHVDWGCVAGLSRPTVVLIHQNRLPRRRIPTSAIPRCHAKVIPAGTDVRKTVLAAIIRVGSAVPHLGCNAEVAAWAQKTHIRVGHGFAVGIVHMPGDGRRTQEAKRDGAACFSIAERDQIAQLADVIGAENRCAGEW